MGGVGKHCDDVCRVDECICSEAGCGGLDDVFDTKGLLVFDGHDLAEQPHDTVGVKIF